MTKTESPNDTTIKSGMPFVRHTKTHQAMTTDIPFPGKPKTRISILVPCEIDDTKKLMDALNHVAQKLRVSTTIRGYAGDGFAWTVSDAKPANDPSSETAGKA